MLPGRRAERRRRLAEPDLEFRAFCAPPGIAPASSTLQLQRAWGRTAGRVPQGERITENTLIRLAVDLLIANAGQLHGSTEDELWRSLGLGD